ncbi:hypothetical protein [Acinetobacter sp. NIPH 2699]|nr:hypothetical protein [Acinetobacter sp. NIPH 2699]MCH7336484.1 hypothetical protein [Acinetobacter sp. NIPH 2699]
MKWAKKYEWKSMVASNDQRSGQRPLLLIDHTGLNALNKDKQKQWNLSND